MKNKTLDKLLKQYVKERLVPQLDEETRKLITYANYDLWFGPIEPGLDPFIDGEEEYEWVGFTKACKLISVGTQDVRGIWIDTDSEEVFETEPEYETDEDYNFAVDSGNIWELSEEDVLKELVGKELYKYL